MTQSLLTIDDSAFIHELVELRLADDGLRQFHANDGVQGMQLAVSMRPDLILLDVIMPGPSGFDVCRELKQDLRTAAIPVIFLTGATDTLNKVQGLDLGAIDYVTKPFEPAELRARVRAALRTKRYQDMLAERAQIDAMTSLRNRAYFDAVLNQEVVAARRYGRPASLALFDLDHFKRVNDEHGHPFGDHVLQQVAELMASSVRECDAACRYGGEEFALVLTETELEPARLVAERVRESVSRLRVMHNKQAVAVTVSAGIVCTTQFGRDDALTPEALLEAADTALYVAKAAGRNRIELADVSRSPRPSVDLCAPLGV
jgi:diguanylate cyclase (GGDEF)-like protein